MLPAMVIELLLLSAVLIKAAPPLAHCRVHARAGAQSSRWLQTHHHSSVWFRRVRPTLSLPFDCNARTSRRRIFKEKNDEAEKLVPLEWEREGRNRWKWTIGGSRKRIERDQFPSEAINKTEPSRLIGVNPSTDQRKGKERSLSPLLVYHHLSLSLFRLPFFAARILMHHTCYSAFLSIATCLR